MGTLDMAVNHTEKKNFVRLETLKRDGYYFTASRQLL